MRYLSASSLKWVLYRSASSLLYQSPSSQRGLIEQSLLQCELDSSLYDIYAISGGLFTNSWREVFCSLLGEEACSIFESAGIVSPPPRGGVVEFVSRDEVKGVVARLLSAIEYNGGRVSLEAIARREQRKSGLAVIDVCATGQLLGSIDFSSREIGVLGGLLGCDERGRFTLAHELGHWYLNHSKYMLREGCDVADIDLHDPPELVLSDLQRLEWQANYFSSCLLLPEESFCESFFTITSRLGLANRGYGALFLDGQSCNLESYIEVSGYLKRRFGVSRSAVRYRLLDLGLLNDVRGDGKSGCSFALSDCAIEPID